MTKIKGHFTAYDMALVVLMFFYILMYLCDSQAVEEIWRRRTEMAAIVGLHLRDRRNTKKRKRSRSKNKPMESLRSRLIVNLLW